MTYNNPTIERLRSFMSKQSGELAVVFDIGTKAIRILIARVDVPSREEEWFATDTFFNQSDMPKLGEELLDTDVLNVKDSPALGKIVDFMSLYLNELRKTNRVQEENISAVGTAVFRWMKNKAEVVAYIKEKTNVTVNVLLKKDEALLSLMSVQHTYAFKRFEGPEIAENDAILLIDQGGGSTEISYFFPNKPQQTHVDSLEDLGTIVLQHHFLTLDSSGLARQSRAADNANPIPQQFEYFLAYIDEKVNEWPGFAALEKQKPTIHAYGMGSALPTDSNFRSHNTPFTLEDIVDIYKGKLTKTARDYKETRQLHAALSEEAPEDKRRNVDGLSGMFGLPVYEKLLDRLHVKDIRFAGFGLRYGALVAKYTLKLDLFDLPDAALRRADADYREREELNEALTQVNKKIANLSQQIDEARALEKDAGRFKLSLMDAWDEREALEDKALSREKTTAEKVETPAPAPKKTTAKSVESSGLSDKNADDKSATLKPKRERIIKK